MDPRIADIEQEYRRDDLPAFAPGDTVLAPDDAP